MKKIIFLCLVPIISLTNIFIIRQARVPEKVRELFQYEFPTLKNPVSITAEIFTGHISKMKLIHPKNVYYKFDDELTKTIQYYCEVNQNNDSIEKTTLSILPVM